MRRACRTFWLQLSLLFILRTRDLIAATTFPSPAVPAPVESPRESRWVDTTLGQPEVAVPVTSARQAERLAKLNYLLQSGSDNSADLAPPVNWLSRYRSAKRDPFGITARGFHEDMFHRDFGNFEPMKKRYNVGSPAREKRSLRLLPNDRVEFPKRRPEMDSAGFYGDTFNGGLGEFWPLRKRWGYPLKTNIDAWRRWYKRKPEMDSSGFFGDTFSSGFGDFDTMKKKSLEAEKRRPEMDSAGFYGDTFSNGFGDFWTVKKKSTKRKPEMDSAGFYGDTFSNGFGDFWTVKKKLNKRRPEMDSAGFYGDTFSNGFGDFWTVKKRSPATLDSTESSADAVEKTSETPVPSSTQEQSNSTQ